MFTTSLLPRRQLLLRRLLAEFTTDRRGRFLVVTGPHGVNKEHFTREFAAELGEFEVNPFLKKRPRASIVVVDDVHLADKDDIQKTLNLVHTKGLTVLATAPHRIPGATDLLALPPLTVRKPRCSRAKSSATAHPPPPTASTTLRVGCHN